MADVTCQSESLSTCGMLHSAGETLHLGEHGQMPLAFLVLHASRVATLIVQGDMLDATPVGSPAACWRSKSGFPAAPYQEHDSCPGGTLDVTIAYYATL